MKDANNIHIKFEGRSGELADSEVKILLIGEALKARERKPLNVKGSLGAVAEFLSKISPHTQSDRIEFNRERRTITYYKNQNNELQDVITGELKLDVNLSKFRINNQSEKLTSEQLALFIKRNRMFFTDFGEHASVVNSLVKFKANVQKKIEKSQDTRANKSSHFEQTVESDVVKDFKVKMPIFIGVEPFEFNVEVCYDITDNNVLFWLESYDLIDLERSVSEQIMNSELELLKPYGLAIIEVL